MNKITKSSQEDYSVLPTLNEEELLPPINPWIGLGGLLLAGSLGMAIVLSHLIEYQVTVQAKRAIVTAKDKLHPQSISSNSSWELEALVYSQDIAKVKDGQKVRGQILGCSGTIQGKVTEITLASELPTTVRSSIESQDTGLFQVTVKPENLQKWRQSDCYLRSGMEGQVNIITEHRMSFWQLFLKMAGFSFE